MIIDLEKELYKEQVVNEFRDDQVDYYDQTIPDICTVQQLEIFHETLLKDLYRKHYKLDFTEDKKNINKRYYILPLVLQSQ